MRAAHNSHLKFNFIKQRREVMFVTGSDLDRLREGTRKKNTWTEK